MRKFIPFIFSLFLSGRTFCQNINDLKKIEPDKDYDNVLSRPVGGDSLSSAFVIWIKKEVKPHYHVMHSENVIVLSGTGMMKLGDKEFEVKEGVHLFIPKGTVHSLKTTSKEPVKVLSIQSPLFDGKDRVMKE